MEITSCITSENKCLAAVENVGTAMVGLALWVAGSK